MARPGNGKAQDRRAEETLQQLGIDPATPMRDDSIPF
jgi:hypothetical protein